MSRNHTDAEPIVCANCGQIRIRATDRLCWDCLLGVTPATGDDGHEPDCPYPNTDAGDCAICAAKRRRTRTDERSRP